MTDENPTGEFELPEEYTVLPATPKNPKHRLIAIVSVIVSVCVILGGVGVYFAIAYREMNKYPPIRYPYILVHGLGGWGAESGINEKAHYWGAGTGSLAEYLNGEGYIVKEASVGPFSSVWDRACELYAQLAGTTVDYGAAHSAASGHERYGRSYAQPLVSGWGGLTDGRQRVRVNLVGHSLGGPTVRLLAHLLANGAPEETGKDVSPLFTGGKGDWINSVTALCSPNNGSTLYCVLDDAGLTDLILELCFSFAGATGNNVGDGFYDFHLEQFGVTQVAGSSTDLDAMKDSLAEVFVSSNDNAGYDLSPDGAAALNRRIELDSDAYYFSYYYCTTHKGSIIGVQIPAASTLKILMPTALLMGAYSGDDDSFYKIDKSWRPNDGLVNTVSAMYPFDEEHTDFDAENIVKGKWNVMPQLEGDHGKVIGLNASAAETHAFYDTLFQMIDALSRKKAE